MNVCQAQLIIFEKFKVQGKVEGNTIVFDAVRKHTNRLVRVVLTLEGEHVKQISVYPWTSEFSIPGTEREFKTLMELFL